MILFTDILYVYRGVLTKFSILRRKRCSYKLKKIIILIDLLFKFYILIIIKHLFLNLDNSMLHKCTHLSV